MMLMTLDETLASCSALVSTPMSSTPPMTPGRAPLPPKIDTPPSSTAAMTDSSRPVALSPWAVPYRNVQNTPPGAAVRPERRDQPGEHEHDELGAVDLDAREGGGLLAQPDREQAAAERGEVHEDGEQH